MMDKEKIRACRRVLYAQLGSLRLSIDDLEAVHRQLGYRISALKKTRADLLVMSEALGSWRKDES